eukprot:3661237-Prymnesium_polylepis.1
MLLLDNIPDLETARKLMLSTASPKAILGCKGARAAPQPAPPHTSPVTSRPMAHVPRHAPPQPARPRHRPAQ